MWEKREESRKQRKCKRSREKRERTRTGERTIGRISMTLTHMLPRNASW